MSDLIVIGASMLAETKDISPGAILKFAGIVIVLVASLVGWIVMRGMRASAMKKWAKSKGLQVQKDRVTGILHGHPIDVTLAGERINKEQMQFEGACTLSLRESVPQGLRVAGRNPMMAGVNFPNDPAFAQSIGVTADDPKAAIEFLGDANLREAIRHFVSVTPGIQLRDGTVTAAVSGIVAIGGDVSHVLDTPLRRCEQFVDALESRARGEPIDLDAIPGLRPGGGLAKGPLKAKNLPTKRKPAASA